MEEIEARRKHEILSMTFYIEQELLRDLTAVLEVLPKHSVKQTEVMGQALNKALHDFASLRKEWHARDAKDFNNDSKYKDEIVKAIDFKFKKVIELGQLVYKAHELNKDSFVRAALKEGNSELIKTLLSLGFTLTPPDNFNYQDSMGETLVVTACRVGNLEVFEALLKDGADVNVVRHDGKSALHLAVDSDSARSFEMFETLLKTAVDLQMDVQDSMGETAIATACRVGNLEVFEALLKAGADVNVVRHDGKSALHLAVDSDSARSFEMFDTLLKTGVDLQMDVQDSMGETAIATACRVGNLEAFEALLKAGADVNVVRGDGKSALHLAIVSGKGRSFEIFEALLEAKADVNVINGDGSSALHLAGASDSARSFEMLETLLKAGADLNMDLRDSMGEPLMATACRVGNFDVFEALLNAGADVNVVRRDGKSALHLAVASDSARCCGTN